MYILHIALKNEVTAKTIQKVREVYRDDVPMSGGSAQSIVSGVVSECQSLPTHDIRWTGRVCPVQPKVALVPPSSTRFHQTLRGGMTSAQPTAVSSALQTSYFITLAAFIVVSVKQRSGVWTSVCLFVCLSLSYFVGNVNAIMIH